MKTRRVVMAACTCTLALVLLVASIARGQTEPCTNALIKDANRVASKQGKEVGSCIKRIGKEQAVASEACLIADPKGRILAASGKTQNDYNAKCLSQLPAFGPGSGSYDPNILNNAAIAKELAIKEIVFGSDISLPGVIVPCSTSGDDCSCQQAIAKNMFKIQAKNLKACASLIKEAGPIADAATLSYLCQSAITADLNNKIGAARLKLAEGIDRKCPVNPFLDGQCAGLPVSALYGCVEPKIECEVCLYLKAIGVLDGSVACDLFDDGLSNSSCEQVCGNGTVEGSEQCDAPDVNACVAGQECDASCRCVGVSHTCSFDGAVDNSTVQLCFGGFCLAPSDISGAVDINCDPGTQDGNGTRSCQCSLQTIAPFAVPGIGTVCIDPLGPCPDGELDCDGGNSLSVDTVADAQIGACTSNTDCASQCAVYCSGMGKAVYASGCENFCENGTRADLPCICDTAGAPTCVGGIAGVNDCPSGSCEGKDNEADTDCHCTCVDTAAGAASAAGTIGCNIGLAVRIEQDTVCDHNQVLVEFPAPECAPFTSATATAVILQSNELATQGPYSESGANESCGNLDVSVTSGYELVSVLTFYDTAVGDILARMTLDCQ